jgi:3-oxoacyl-[acyl-carrier protein] reductase
VWTRAVDVSDGQQVAAAVREVAAWSGALDIVVNNAGITRDTVVWKMTDEQWRAVLDVHLGGTFATTRAAVPIMRAAGFGRIINVTSYTGLHGTVGQANYAAAKGGIVAFTKTVAKETARFGITVNAISPNAATSMVTAVGEERLAVMTASVPVGRFAEPAEMATAVGFLAADESAYVTGVVIPVDGGLSM